MRNIYIPFEKYQVNDEVKIFSPVNETVEFIYHIPVDISGSWKNVEKK